MLESAATLEAVSKANGHEGNGRSRTGYGLVISNPPYFKIGKDDPRAVAWGVRRAWAAQYLCPCSWRFPPSCYRSPGSSSTSYRGALHQALISRDFERPSSTGSLPPLSISSSPGRKYSRIRPCSRRTWCSQAGGAKDGEAVDESQVLVSHSKAANDLASRRRLLVGMNAVLDPAKREQGTVYSRLRTGLGASASRADLAQHTPLSRLGKSPPAPWCLSGRHLF